MPETKKYYHNLDVDNNKVINPLLNPLTTAQRTAVGTLLGSLDEGYVCFDTTLNQQYFWDGAAWVTVTATTTWGSITGTITAQADLTAYLAANYYPLATNPAGYLTAAAANLLYYPLSSNPANYIDLTDLSAGTGISYNNLTGVITNSAPDQTVVLTGGTGISTSGTYPNFTITNSAPDQTVSIGTTGSGLSVTGTYPSFTLQNTLPDQTVALTAGTGINTSGTYPNFTITNSAPDQTVALTSGTGISVTGTYPNFTITNTSPSSGGTVTGTGTTNYVPKWSSSSALTNSSIFDNGTSVGIGTALPNAANKLQVAGIISSTTGFNADTNAGVKTGLYSGGNSFTFWAGNNQLSTYTLVGNIAGVSYFSHTIPFNNSGGASGTQSAWRIASSVADTGVNSMIHNQLLIDPQYVHGVLGTGALRGVYYNPTLTSLNGAPHIAWENTSGDIIHGNLSGVGTRMVTADSTGTLGTTAIPTGTVTGVTASSPLFSSGGATPNITIQQASGSQNGFLSSTDWTTFNGKQNAITLTTTGTSGAATFIANTLNIPQYQAAGTYVTSVGATGPITSSGGTTPTISTSMATNRLIGRTTAGTGVMEEISVGTGLTLSSGTLSANVSGTIPKGTASGTDTYTTTIAGVTSYSDGDAYLIRFTNGNTTSATLNINGLGAIPLYRNNDGALIGGDIIANGEMICVYNSTLTGFQTIGTAPNTLLGYVTNADSVTITKGQVVYAFGGQGDRMTVKLASNTADATSARTVGVVMSTSIAANQKGLIMMQGLLDGLSILPTATYSDGDSIYLGATAGSITKVKPYAPNHLVYVATVTTASNGAAGRMYVNIQNGYELDELHNVQAQSPALKDTLWYDSTVSPGQWKTASISTILGYTPVGGSGTTGAIIKFTGATTIGDATVDVDYMQQNDVITGYQLMGSVLKGVNLLASNPMQMSATGLTLSSQRLEISAVYLQKSTTITGVKWFQTTNGSYTANNYNGIGLYMQSGGILTLAASSTNDGTIWQSGAGWKSKAFSTPFTASRGIYYIGILYSASAQTTAPGIGGTVSSSGTWSGLSTVDFTNNEKIYATINAQTTLTTPIALSTLGTGNSNRILFYLY